MEKELKKKRDDMEKFSQEEIAQSVAAFESLVSKCTKAKRKLAKGTAQWTLITRRIRAFEIALVLLGNLEAKG